MPPYQQQNVQMPMINPYYYNNGYLPQYSSRLPQEMQASMNYLKCRPVTSFDEVKAAQVDLDGSLNVFPDIGNKRIYTKQIKPDGTADYQVYSLTSQEVMSSSTDYVTKAELEQIIAQLKSSLMASIAPTMPEAQKKISF